MWSIVTGGLVEIIKGWFDVKKSKQQAEAQYNLAAAKGEQDWDLEAIKASRYSYKDELITIIIFSPLVIAWFDQKRAEAWIKFASQMPVWYQVIMFGIVAASFGLRWWFKSQGLNAVKSK